MSLKSCLRCDWQGETKEPACPNCGVRPLYVLGTAGSSREAEPAAKSGPQEPDPEAASLAPPSQEDSAQPSTDEVESPRRSARSAIAFVLAAVVVIVTLGTWFNADAERSVPAPAPAPGAPTTPADTATPSDVSPEPAVPRSNGSLVRIDTRTGTIVSRMPIQFPKLLASDGRSVWVFDEGNLATPKLIQVDALNDGLPKAANIQLPDALVTAGGVDVATALAVAGGSVWLRDDAGGMYVLRPGARAVEPTTFDALGLRSLNIDAGLVGEGNSLWVPTHPQGPCCTGPSDLHQVDVGTGKAVAQIEAAGQVVASGTGFVWASDEDTHAHAGPRLMRFDTETGATEPIGALSFLWADLTVADGSVWASNPEDGTIVRLDPMTADEIDWIHVAGAPGAITAGGGDVWAAIGENGTVVRYDMGTGRIGTIDVGGTPSDLVFADGSVWVTVFGYTGLTVPPGPIVLDLRTGGVTSLVSLAGGSDFAASRDGTRLAYVGIGDDGNRQIFTAGTDGTGVRQITHDPSGSRWPAWSPDGTMVAYVGRGGDLFVFDVSSGGARRVTDETARWSGQAQFTPDGSSLVFTGGSSILPVLRIVPVAGGRSKILFELVDGLTDSGSGSLSPDGSRLTFVGSGSFESGHCGPCHFVANADGTDKQVFPINCNWNPAGTWSPDGNRIVCVDDARRIIVVDIATGDTSPVAEGNGAIWLDRHTLLVEGSAPSVPSGGGTVERPPTDRLTRTVAGVRFSLRVPKNAWSEGPISPGPNGSGSGPADFSSARASWDRKAQRP